MSRKVVKRRVWYEFGRHLIIFMGGNFIGDTDALHHAGIIQREDAKHYWRNVLGLPGPYGYTLKSDISRTRSGCGTATKKRYRLKYKRWGRLIMNQRNGGDSRYE